MKLFTSLVHCSGLAEEQVINLSASCINSEVEKINMLSSFLSHVNFTTTSNSLLFVVAEHVIGTVKERQAGKEVKVA